VTRTVISFALWPLIIMFSPVIIVAGEPASRYVMRRMRRTASTAQVADVRDDERPARVAPVQLSAGTSLLLAVISHPLWIALTAPGRWVSDRFRRHPRGPADR
jgi:predicted 2-oxoglutarate/Fe(II)-dependent dioxygenase YbiX